MTPDLFLTACVWLAVGVLVTRWGLRRDRRAKLLQKRFHRLVHRARDTELRSGKLWTFIVLSSKAKHPIYPLNARTLAKERVDAGGRN